MQTLMLIVKRSRCGRDSGNLLKGGRMQESGRERERKNWLRYDGIFESYRSHLSVISRIDCDGSSLTIAPRAYWWICIYQRGRKKRRIDAAVIHGGLNWIELRSACAIRLLVTYCARVTPMHIIVTQWSLHAPLRTRKPRFFTSESNPRA